jgi:hypothetical protein
MAWISRVGKCPICERSKYLSLTYTSSGIVGTRPSGSFDCDAECKRCGYTLSFPEIEFSFFLPFLFMFTIFPLALWAARAFALPCLFLGVVFAACFIVPWIMMILFVKLSYFDRYINKRILKKAKKMLEKGIKESNWTGDTFENYMGIQSWELEDKLRILRNKGHMSREDH